MPVGSLMAGRGYPSGAFRPDVDDARNGKPVEAAQFFSPVGTPKMADERKFASRSSGPEALTRSRRGELSSRPEREEDGPESYPKVGYPPYRGGSLRNFGVRK